ncbi:PAS domain-containing sensor histidine kinase [Mucilaginibacter pallidiroseus]|uniref:histidine kinase n=1 Tax=Mucilaginibacter pallidiroseus TaxID=2599295 RepID=A0A563UET3_9SPHI|nr:PAS domain-containing sensor histidine kinase [Mucilaginibacter pallidiroseus]TWR29769.1 PAS domain-containing sensor histidine kinase [Mucilaginibacter pallidiroseus]
MRDFKVLFYDAPSPMWVFDINNLNILDVNKAATRVYGYTYKEFLGMTIAQLRPREDLEMMFSALSGLNSHRLKAGEFRHTDKNGTVFSVEIISYSVEFKGRPARVVVAQNIDDRRAIAGQLEITQAKLNKILETTGVGFFQVDVNHRIIYWNYAAEVMIGYQREYVIGKDLWEIFAEARHTDFDTKLEEAIAQNTKVEFTYYFWPVQKWLNISAYPLADGLIVHFRDITESKLYEERLLEKIEQMQEISYFNSHYIRKPVASLLGLASLIINGNVADNEYREVAGHIEACSVELDEVLHKINNKVNDEFANSLFEQVETFSITQLLKKIAKDFKRAGINQHIVVKGCSKSIDFFGNRQGLEIAVKCLIDNAVKFSEPTSNIELCLEIIGGNVILSVRDFGVGINRQLVNTIFVGFTKKSVARKLGRGLAKVAEVAHRHNGAVWVESQPAKGAIFSMRLPVSSIAGHKKCHSDKGDQSLPGVEVTYNSELNYIVTDWNGFHSGHSVKTGCFKILNAVITHGCTKILNDNTHLLGTWDTAVEWVAKTYFPMLQEAGVTHVAWVYSKSTFSRLATDMTIESVAANVVTKPFEDAEEAKQWLITQPIRQYQEA